MNAEAETSLLAASFNSRSPSGVSASRAWSRAAVAVVGFVLAGCGSNDRAPAEAARPLTTIGSTVPLGDSASDALQSETGPGVGPPPREVRQACGAVNSLIVRANRDGVWDQTRVATLIRALQDAGNLVGLGARLEAAASEGAQQAIAQDVIAACQRLGLDELVRGAIASSG